MKKIWIDRCRKLDTNTVNIKISTYKVKLWPYRERNNYCNPNVLCTSHVPLKLNLFESAPIQMIPVNLYFRKDLIFSVKFVPHDRKVLEFGDDISLSAFLICHMKFFTRLPLVDSPKGFSNTFKTCEILTGISGEGI